MCNVNKHECIHPSINIRSIGIMASSMIPLITVKSIYAFVIVRG